VERLTVTAVNGSGAAVGNPLALASGAIVTVNANGSYTYNPNGAFNSLAVGQSTIDTFTYTASDGYGGTDAATVTITVNGVNDAPVLDASKSPALSSVTAGAGVPSGAVGTLVSALVDFASPTGQVDNVTDVDSGALLGIAITNADTTNGAWWYSTDNGTSWFALGAVADNNALLLAADVGTRVYFQPAPAFSGTIPNAITLRAWDRTSGANGALADTTINGGTTAFSIAADTASIDVLSADQNVTVALSRNVASISEEAGGTVAFTITLSQALNATNTLSVDLTDVAGGAQSGTDTTAALTAAIDAALVPGVSRSGSTLTFNGASFGGTTFSFNLTAANDALVEGTEALALQLAG
ncbi:MAG: Ig-like domain-containing protein, partial [Candidatus Methylomirabilales bacterium]